MPNSKEIKTHRFKVNFYFTEISIDSKHSKVLLLTIADTYTACAVKVAGGVRKMFLELVTKFDEETWGNFFLINRKPSSKPLFF